MMPIYRIGYIESKTDEVIINSPLFSEGTMTSLLLEGNWETPQNEDIFIYDLQVFDHRGNLLEKWQGLQLQVKILSRHGWHLYWHPI